MFFTNDNATLHYDIVGSGIPLLCLPAFPFDGRMYREQRALAAVAQVIIPDLRGTGRSSVTDGPYTMELHARDMFALLDHLEIRRAVESLFNVKVSSVNVMNRLGKRKRLRSAKTGKRSDWKKAVVTLRAGDKIDLI